METINHPIDRLGMGTHAEPSWQSLPISQLRASLKGQVVTPEDADYDAVRTGLSREAVRRPALIVRPLEAGDVSRVVSLARAADMAEASCHNGK